MHQTVSRIAKVVWRELRSLREFNWQQFSQFMSRSFPYYPCASVSIRG